MDKISLPLYSIRIQEERNRRDLTIKELSEASNVPYNSIRNYEKGLRSITKKNAEKLANFFDVSVPYIMGLTDFKTKEDFNLFDEQLEQLKSYNIQQMEIIFSELKSLMVELEKMDDEQLKHEVLNSVINTVSHLDFFASGADHDNLNSVNTTLSYLFDGLRGIYGLRFKTKDETESYKTYLLLREHVINSLDDFYDRNK